MLKNLKFNKQILYIFGSNIISLLIGAGLSFFIPYVLSVDDYGYYKLFTFYLET